MFEPTRGGRKYRYAEGTHVPEERQDRDPDTPRVLAVKLETGDELEIDAGTDLESARAQLGSFYSDIDTHKFVRFDDDTVVRSSQIAFMQLRGPCEMSSETQLSRIQEI